MEAPKDIVIPRTPEYYFNNIDARVREADMQTNRNYRLIAELQLSRFEVGEFHARLDQIHHRDTQLGRASLLLAVIDPDTDTPLVFRDAHSEAGILVTPSTVRITHPRVNNIGTITGGYLLEANDVLSPDSQAVPHSLNEAAHQDYADTRTGILTLSHIHLGYN